MSRYSNENLLMLSGLQHYVFCKRQWYLIHQENQWQDNYLTQSGNIMHDRTHSETKTERRGDLLITRALPISSSELGIYGVCDVVEWRRTSSELGARINNYDGYWIPTPVEYKRGRVKQGQEDIIQVVAQAMCLEEMLLCTIKTCYIYYGETRRRLEVTIDDNIRKYLQTISTEMHEIQQSKRQIKPRFTHKCKSCSLSEICLPKLLEKQNVDSYIQKALGQ